MQNGLQCWQYRLYTCVWGIGSTGGTDGPAVLAIQASHVLSGPAGLQYLQPNLLLSSSDLSCRCQAAQMPQGHCAAVNCILAAGQALKFAGASLHVVTFVVTCCSTVRHSAGTASHGSWWQSSMAGDVHPFGLILSAQQPWVAADAAAALTAYIPCTAHKCRSALAGCVLGWCFVLFCCNLQPVLSIAACWGSALVCYAHRQSR